MNLKLSLSLVFCVLLQYGLSAPAPPDPQRQHHYDSGDRRLPPLRNLEIYALGTRNRHPSGPDPAGMPPGNYPHLHHNPYPIAQAQNPGHPNTFHLNHPNNAFYSNAFSGHPQQALRSQQAHPYQDEAGTHSHQANPNQAPHSSQAGTHVHALHPNLPIHTRLQDPQRNQARFNGGSPRSGCSDPQCSGYTFTIQHYLEHLERIHFTLRRVDPSFYLCNICSVYVRGRLNLIHHMQIHNIYFEDRV